MQLVDVDDTTSRRGHTQSASVSPAVTSRHSVSRDWTPQSVSLTSTTVSNVQIYHAISARHISQIYTVVGLCILLYTN